MNTNDIIARLNRHIPQAVLEVRPFGRSGQVSVWIEMRSIGDVAKHLATDPEIGLDWLENMAAIQMEDTVVISYFLRSSWSPGSLILRGSLLPSSADSYAEVSSVVGVWPMAGAYEREIGELFGVSFDGQNYRRLLPEGWEGFPLRKTYVFPKKVFGISHSRVPTQSDVGEWEGAE